MPNPLLLITGIAKAYQAYTTLSKTVNLTKGMRRGRGRRRKPPMKNFFALIGGAVLILGGTGYYLDWFNVGNLQSANGKKSLQIEFDSEKIRADLQKGTDKLKDTLDGLGDNPKPQSEDPALSKIKEGVKDVQTTAKDGKQQVEEQWRKSRDNFFDFGKK